MKLAFAGKGGVGKTTLTAWTADFLARQGHDVWMVDADTALSLGQAGGLLPEDLPVPLILREDLVRDRIGSGCLNLNPEVDDLPEALSVTIPLGATPPPDIAPGTKRLLVMGSVTEAGGGCACAANALLKALLAHLVLERNDWVLVDLEAGVEHLGRGTVASVDGLVIVSEPSMRSLETAARIGDMAATLGLARQVLALNRHNGSARLPELDGLPSRHVVLPCFAGLVERQLHTASVLGLPETLQIDSTLSRLLNAFGNNRDA